MRFRTPHLQAFLPVPIRCQVPCPVVPIRLGRRSLILPCLSQAETYLVMHLIWVCGRTRRERHHQLLLYQPALLRNARGCLTNEQSRYSKIGTRISALLVCQASSRIPQESRLVQQELVVALPACPTAHPN